MKAIYRNLYGPNGTAESFDVAIMSIVDSWAMVRRPGSIPFVVRVNDLTILIGGEMSNTPETDSYWECWDRSGSNRDDLDKEFARRLERERDKLRAENAHLLKEMQRYLPILERLEEDASLWFEFSGGTGLATANGYRNAITKAKEEA